jgi:hypothetical protein
MLIKAFYHLLMKGENLDWLDLLWLEQEEPQPEAAPPRRIKKPKQRVWRPDEERYSP